MPFYSKYLPTSDPRSCWSFFCHYKWFGLFLFGHKHGTRKFLDQGLNLCRSSSPGHCSDSARSLNCWAARELHKCPFLPATKSPHGCHMGMSHLGVFLRPSKEPQQKPEGRGYCGSQRATQPQSGPRNHVSPSNMELPVLASLCSLSLPCVLESVSPWCGSAPLFMLSFLSFLFYWGTVDLQYYISLRCTTEWLMIFKGYISLIVTIRYWLFLGAVPDTLGFYLFYT